jgi:hypothetical protein
MLDFLMFLTTDIRGTYYPLSLIALTKVTVNLILFNPFHTSHFCHVGCGTAPYVTDAV